MKDLKREIIKTLMLNKKPITAYQIGKALHTSQTHIEYHLEQLVKQGRAIPFKDHAKKYSCQLVLISDKVRDDFYEVIVAAMPKLLAYIDLSYAEDDGAAFIHTMADLLDRLEQDFRKEIRNCKKV